jgi:hypothetical protein
VEKVFGKLGIFGLMMLMMLVFAGGAFAQVADSVFTNGATNAATSISSAVSAMAPQLMVIVVISAALMVGIKLLRRVAK